MDNEKQIKQPKPFVILSGHMGTGKSELGHLLAEAANWKILRGKSGAYVYFKDFTADMKRWSFHNQFQFLLYKFQQHATVTLETETRSVCQERGAYECFEVFSRKLFEDGLMSQRDFICLTEFYDLVSSYMPHPDLIIYLTAPIEVVYHRVIRRGGIFAQVFSRAYLDDLEARYNNWIDSVAFCPVIKVDTSQVDYVNNIDDRKGTLDKIDSALRELGMDA